MIIIHAPPRLHDKQFCFFLMVVVNLFLHPAHPMNHYFKKIYKKERVGMDKKTTIFVVYDDIIIIINIIIITYQNNNNTIIVVHHTVVGFCNHHKQKGKSFRNFNVR